MIKQGGSVVEHDRYDVVILGAGAAGLTLAVQLRNTRPETTILVVEKQDRALEAAHKVGESTVDIGAHYLRNVLRIETHMVTEQLDKFGLRFFFTQGDNRDITRRVELGHGFRPDVGATYQIDRGRFENHLIDEISSRGVDVRLNHRVDKVHLGEAPGQHTIVVSGPQGTRTVHAQWVVDTSGRTGLVKRQRGLTKPNGHNVNAVWFRIDAPLNIDDWSTSPQWRQRISDGYTRRLSTNHFMGEGYWVWYIPLASDSISIGIVVDADLHPFERMNRFERALEWLKEFEPQCAENIEAHRDALLDFKVLKNYSYGCEQVYSADGWCLSGEAGIFLDPLYSPGFDVISMSNGLITDLVVRSLQGRDVTDLAAIHNTVFFMVTDGWLPIYEGQYPIMGNARVMSAKVIWDTGVYWAVPALLFFNDAFRDISNRYGLIQQLARMSTITVPIQRFFLQWYAVEPREHADGFTTYYDFDFMTRFHQGMSEQLQPAALEARLKANMDELERIAGELIDVVVTECEQAADEERRAQAAVWQADKSLMHLVHASRDAQSPTPAWQVQRHRPLNEQGFAITPQDTGANQTPQPVGALSAEPS